MAPVQDTNTAWKFHTANQAGPASYATGGFVIDLSGTFSVLDFLELAIVTPGALPPVHFEVLMNRDASGFAPGKAVVKLMRDRYDKASAGNVQGQPGGVTVQAAKTSTATTTGSSHTHAIDHDHPVRVTDSPTAAGNGVATALGGNTGSDHRHDTDIAAFAGSSGASTHSHQRGFEYQHGHSVTNAATNAASVEVAAATNLSGTTFRLLAVGQ